MQEDSAPLEALPRPVPLLTLGRTMRYQIGRERRALFGLLPTRVVWRDVSRSEFYYRLVSSGALSPRSDFEGADILYAGGMVSDFGPWRFRALNF